MVVVATMCYNTNILAALLVILSAIFYEAMQGKSKIANLLTHEFNHHPDQIESVAIIEYLLDDNDYMKEARLRHEREPLKKLKQDRYALWTSPIPTLAVVADQRSVDSANVFWKLISRGARVKPVEIASTFKSAGCNMEGLA
ncbi:phenylalanine ammonia-lyase class 1-like [Elaeis guineensis]|uniref:phenylalanine ammonia-lyase class 1-like n=1 Tax=Elaeis guineensis var. tenera TaxID=51953 RepID=UPI003C6CFC70